MRSSLPFIMVFPVVMFGQTSVGPNNPAAASNTMCSFSFSSTVGYMPASNILASDNQYATASHCDCCDQNTQCLFVTSFGFSIPLTATINGIVAEVEKRSSANGQMQDNPVMILKNGMETGTTHALPGNWGYTDQYYTYGNSTDLWGATWAPSDINNSGFGLGFASISYTCFGNNQPVTSYIDHVRITVYYTDMSTGISSSQTNGEFTVHPTAQDQFTLQLPSGMYSGNIFVMDVTGKCLLEKNIAAGERLTIPCRGLLLFRLSDEKTFYYKKIINN